MTAFVMRRWNLQHYPFPQAPLHVHERGDEAFVVLTGLLDVTLDSEVRRLQAGEFALIEAGTQHTFATVDETPTSILVAMTPDVDSLVRELHQVPEEERPLVWARHHARVVGRPLMAGVPTAAGADATGRRGRAPMAADRPQQSVQ